MNNEKMMRITRLEKCTKAVLVALAFLVGCSGTGVDYNQQVEKSVTTQNGTAFIAREGQWVGGGVLMKVTLNGSELGDLGNNEILTGKIKPGQNTLTIKPQGLGKLSYSDESYNFQGADNTNAYFMVDLNNKLLGFGSSIVITETTEASFKANAQ